MRSITFITLLLFSSTTLAKEDLNSFTLEYRDHHKNEALHLKKNSLSYKTNGKQVGIKKIGKVDFLLTRDSFIALVDDDILLPLKDKKELMKKIVTCKHKVVTLKRGKQLYGACLSQKIYETVSNTKRLFFSK